ncbi:MAG: radical SAM family heme chaperone HemW [Phycisphaeraceae bacterium]|nr:radical SAM family heme chaperone HemW [Phycisphaeraceae bacterium]
MPCIWQHHGEPLRADIPALYIHLPFCFHKCHYCDFYSIVDRDSQRHAALVDRILDELAYYRNRSDLPDWRPRTIFVGGGTPTFLEAGELTRLLRGLAMGHASSGPFEEFTVEANPETLTDNIAELLVECGVNRISIGAQSFQPELLKTLERWHEPSSVRRAVKIARAAGITNINLDLIFGIPGQTHRQLEDDLDRILDPELSPTHLSCYSLTYEPNTAMMRRLELGQFKPLDNHTVADFYATVRQRLADAGLKQYEISNWCKPGYHCRHNLAYWTNLNWLGLGPSASSHINGQRWKNVPQLGRYLASSGCPPRIDIEHLPSVARIGERLMLGLRLIDGMPQSIVDSLLNEDASRRSTFDHLIEIGMIERKQGHYRLSEKALFISDTVLAELV